MLLGNKTVDYNGTELTLEELPNDSHRESGASRQGSGIPAAVTPFLPRAGRGRGRKLGIGARRGGHGMDVDGAESNSAAAQTSSDQPAEVPAVGARSQADFKALLLGKKSS